MKRCKKHVAPLYHYEPETQGRPDVTQIEMFDYEEPPVTPVKRRTVPAAKMDRPQSQQPQV